MTQDQQYQTVTQFYDTHPINEEKIIQNLKKQKIPIKKANPKYIISCLKSGEDD